VEKLVEGVLAGEKEVLEKSSSSVTVSTLRPYNQRSILLNFLTLSTSGNMADPLSWSLLNIFSKKKVDLKYRVVIVGFQTFSTFI
jgi:hypothetical protein